MNGCKTEMNDTEELYRQLCIEKDLRELAGWMDVMNQIHEEIVYLRIFETQLIKDLQLANQLLGIRRENTLLMGHYCTYEKEIKEELQYGKKVYNNNRASLHERKRAEYVALLQNFSVLKARIFQQLAKYQRS